MTETDHLKKKKYKVSLDIDLAAEIEGFASAKSATKAHHRIMRNLSSTIFVGPPPSDDLLELVLHLFTEDEADLVQHIPPMRPRTAEKVAKLSGRPVDEVRKVLDHLADTKKVIVALGEEKRYIILPLIFGIFEFSLMYKDLSDLNSWNKKLIEIFERIWDTGYIRNYVAYRPPPVRYIPAVGLSNSLTTAWPVERLEEVLDLYDTFAIGNCQCRVGTRLVGRGCDKPIENCLWMGEIAEFALRRDFMRKATRDEALEAKKEAEANQCVTWMLNEFGDPRGNASCSCCGCCCKALRTVNQFSAPGLICKPHFMPRLDFDKCNMCSKCVLVCPMGAWKKIGARLYFEEMRCVGCGLCVISCKQTALELKEVPDARPPESSLTSLLGKDTFYLLKNSFKMWTKRILNL